MLYRAEYEGFETYFDVHFAPDELITPKEVRITFRNDTANRSYMTQSGNRTAVYSLIFIVTGNTVTKVFHDGTDVTSAWDVPVVSVNELYSASLAFDKWNGDTANTKAAVSAAAIAAAQAEQNELTLTAVLKTT